MPLNSYNRIRILSSQGPILILPRERRRSSADENGNHSPTSFRLREESRCVAHRAYRDRTGSRQEGDGGDQADRRDGDRDDWHDAHLDKEASWILPESSVV